MRLRSQVFIYPDLVALVFLLSMTSLQGNDRTVKRELSKYIKNHYFSAFNNLLST